MKTRTVIAISLVSSAILASPAAAISLNDSSSAVQAAGSVKVGWSGRRGAHHSESCKPYNGPYGYYGNPYCEGGFNRYGKSGKYEIDLTRFFDDRYYDRRERRRWR